MPVFLKKGCETSKMSIRIDRGRCVHCVHCVQSHSIAFNCIQKNKHIKVKYRDSSMSTRPKVDLLIGTKRCTKEEQPTCTTIQTARTIAVFTGNSHVARYGVPSIHFDFAQGKPRVVVVGEIVLTDNVHVSARQTTNATAGRSTCQKH